MGIYVLDIFFTLCRGLGGQDPGWSSSWYKKEQLSRGTRNQGHILEPGKTKVSSVDWLRNSISLRAIDCGCGSSTFIAEFAAAHLCNNSSAIKKNRLKDNETHNPQQVPLV